MGTLLEQAAERFAKANAPWLSILASRLTVGEMVYEQDRDSWRYRLCDVHLRLTLHPLASTAGPNAAIAPTAAATTPTAAATTPTAAATTPTAAATTPTAAAIAPTAAATTSTAVATTTSAAAIAPTAAATAPAYGPLCGDNGGLTSKKAPCRLKAKANGRCATHQPPPVPSAATTHVATPDPAPALRATAQHASASGSSVAGGIGPGLVRRLYIRLAGAAESTLRPVPAPLRWDQLHFYTSADGGEALVARVARSDDTLTFYSASRVWDEIILQVKDALRLPPEACVLVQNTLVYVDPAWLGQQLYQAAGLDATRMRLVTAAGAEVLLDHPLRDYDVRSMHATTPSPRVVFHVRPIRTR